MEHSAQYRKMMRKQRQRERRRRGIMTGAAIACGVIAAVLGASLLFLRSGIKKEHQLAVDDYNAKNWQTVTAVPGGKSIEGCIEGEPYSYVDDGTYFEGVYVDGISLKGMTYEQARETLLQHVTEKLSAVNMSLQVENANMVLSASDCDFTVNVNEILDEAYRLGRESKDDYAANYRRQQELKATPAEYSIEYRYNENSIAERVARIAEFVNTKPTEPYVTASKRKPVNTYTASESDEGYSVYSESTFVHTVTAPNGYAVGYLVFNPGKIGYTLNEQSMVNDITAAIDNGEYTKEITAELELTAPETTIEQLKEEVVLISTYKTEFESSNLNRRRNIQKAADIMNACTVKPWQEISFNEYVGPRTEAGGWLPAPGIVNGNDYEDSPGGGICQMTGTLYNALLQCGPDRIKITARQHHSWPSSYVPIGLDSTVDTGGPDLCWKNVSDESLFIFSYANVNEGQRNLYVYIFGKPHENGVYYKTYAETIDVIEPEPTEYVNDNSLPAGTTKVLIRSRQGYTAKAYLQKYGKDGELLETTLLYTDYYFPVRGKVAKGTGPAQ